MSKVGSRLDRTARQTKRKQHIAHDLDDEANDVVEWGQRLDGQDASMTDTVASSTKPSARHVTTNNDLHRSVLVNGTEYRLELAVWVQSSSDTLYLAIVYRLWESKQGGKQVMARWLLRQSEKFVNKKSVFIGELDWESFYCNSKMLDPLIDAEMFKIIKSLY
ncbi:hypothetical protein IWW38_003756 [Coemansia aciculifera]|uniref:Uncharacterized protein n=1 Tax=Coemansia aciculifera TaxID=417176 RepID=A0ACC1M0R0_9FUNG|nr:hypothetical protein IWW38_003756 [Coemansia aciculifera]